MENTQQENNNYLNLSHTIIEKYCRLNMLAFKSVTDTQFNVINFWSECFNDWLGKIPTSRNPNAFFTTEYEIIPGYLENFYVNLNQSFNQLAESQSELAEEVFADFKTLVENKLETQETIAKTNNGKGTKKTAEKLAA